MSLLGNGPSAMKSAVMMPQAMNAAMFGITMLERKVPNRCTWTRALVGFFGADAVADVCVADVIVVPRFCCRGLVR